ncbi:MAG: hypothetical protein GX675_01080 [Erysipelotrichaceae bacterium]|nr:hypothetical protein [Erysipelotrichaceae bacterium]
MKLENLININTSMEIVSFDEEEVLRVVKTNKVEIPDENTYVKLKDCLFHNGTIEVKMLSRLLKDAPEHARGFIGIAFRISDDDSKFESFYIRPTNAFTTDPVRKNRGCQYFSYPKYTFSYFRDKGITDYENPIKIGLDEWVNLKAVIKDSHGLFYLNNELVLEVKDMKHGKDLKGSVGLFIDIGTEGFFKDLKVELDD